MPVPDRVREILYAAIDRVIAERRRHVERAVKRLLEELENMPPRYAVAHITARAFLDGIPLTPRELSEIREAYGLGPA